MKMAAPACGGRGAVHGEREAASHESIVRAWCGDFTPASRKRFTNSRT